LQRIGEDEKEPGPDFSLGGNIEEALHKSLLPLNVTFAYSLNLPFSHHMHRLITLDCSTCRSKTEEPESGIDAPFDEPMVLLDEVVQMVTLSQLSESPRDSRRQFSLNQAATADSSCWR